MWGKMQGGEVTRHYKDPGLTLSELTVGVGEVQPLMLRVDLMAKVGFLLPPLYLELTPRFGAVMAILGKMLMPLMVVEERQDILEEGEMLFLVRQEILILGQPEQVIFQSFRSNMVEVVEGLAL